MYFDFEENSGGYLVRIGYEKQKTSSDFTKDFTKGFTKEKRKDIIIELVKQKPQITASEIAEILHLTRRTIMSEIEGLKAVNKIRRIGGRKTGRWEVI